MFTFVYINVLFFGIEFCLSKISKQMWVLAVSNFG